MRYLTVEQVLRLHQRVLHGTQEDPGIKDWGMLESAVAQPRMTFGQDLYPTLADKAAALAYSLALNHAFQSGNKRTAHAATEAFLVVNGAELDASADEQEQVMLELAAGNLDRKTFTEWVKQHLVELSVSSR